MWRYGCKMGMLVVDLFIFRITASLVVYDGVCLAACADVLRVGFKKDAIYLKQEEI